MLRPNKHTDIKYSIPYISVMMMKEINDSGIIRYDDLKKCLSEKIGKGVNEKFELTLTFLYKLRKIEYINNLDSIKKVN